MCPVCNKGRRCVLEVEEKVDPYGCCEEWLCEVGQVGVWTQQPRGNLCIMAVRVIPLLGLLR